MLRAQFGLIDEIDYNKDYSEYEPQKYNCVCIDDDEYINDWWPQLCGMRTFFHSMARPETALARWGVTIIPPSSLPFFRSIVLGDERVKTDANLEALAGVIQTAIESEKHMIHFGV